MKKVCFILALCSVASAANNFSGDSNAVALWNLESGALGTDSLGGNTLTLLGSSVTADTDAGVVSEMLIAMLWGLGFYAGFVGDTRQMLAVTDEFLRLVVAGCLPGGR